MQSRQPEDAAAAPGESCTQGPASTLGAARGAHTGTGGTLQSRGILALNEETWKQPSDDPKTELLRSALLPAQTPGWCWHKRMIPRGDTGIVAPAGVQGWREWHGMLGEASALGILSVESRKSWGRKGTFFSPHFWPIIFKISFLEILLIVTFSEKKMKENIIPINSPSLEVLDTALNKLV